MDLIYFYSIRSNAPAKVAQSVIKYIHKNKHNIPFKNVQLLSDYKGNLSLDSCPYFRNTNLKNIILKSDDSLVHIPISILVMPNRKFLLYLLSIITRKKIILQYHGDLREEMKIKWRYTRKVNLFYIPSYIFIPYLLRSATAVITHSYLIGNVVTNVYGVKNCYVVPNALESDWFLESYKKPSVEILSKNNINIFYHGRLSPEKGVDLLIKGFSEALYTNSNMILYIAGDGPQKDALVELCNNLNILDNVYFLGYLLPENIRFYLKHVDLAIYPSIWDNFPLTFLEALSAAKCPVFLSESTGITDFIKLSHIKLLTFNPSIDNISDVIINFRSYHDDSIVDIQYNFAKKFNWDSVINYYINIYQDLVT